MHIALLHLAAGDRFLDRHDDDVADRRGLALRSAKHLDAHHPPRTRIVGHVEVGFSADHAAIPSAGAATAGWPLRSTTIHVLRLLIGRHSSMRTVSPILQRFSSSCAAYFFERRMNFLYSGCMTRRSTSTVTVLSILSLVT